LSIVVSFSSFDVISTSPIFLSQFVVRGRRGGVAVVFPLFPQQFVVVMCYCGGDGGGGGRLRKGRGRHVARRVCCVGPRRHKEYRRAPWVGVGSGRAALCARTAFGVSIARGGGVVWCGEGVVLDSQFVRTFGVSVAVFLRAHPDKVNAPMKLRVFISGAKLLGVP
jgi:hypothetical protein